MTRPEMTRWRLPTLWTAPVLLALLLSGAAAPAGDLADSLWRETVEPLLERNCAKCHGGVRQQGELDVRSLWNLLVGGEQGSAIVPGDPENSLLWQYVRDGVMPPESDPLTPDEQQAVADWIASLPPRAAVLAEDVPAERWPRAYVAALAARHAPQWRPPATATLPEAIDGFLEFDWRRQGVAPAQRARQETLLRRISLDLIGRIPTLEEQAEFFSQPETDRWERLVDQLLEHPESARRLREVFDVVLMGRTPASQEARRGAPTTQRRMESGWHAYLEEAFRTNRPWNRIVQEIIVARPATAEDRGQVWFLYERGSDHQAMAEALGPVAFGMRIDCAQCHNHPLAWEVEQKHYWGLVAALNRSLPVETDHGPAMSESAVGGFVNFSNLKKESQPALMSFLNGMTVHEEWPAADAQEIDDPELYHVPPPARDESQPPQRGRRGGPLRVAEAAVPKFSRREELARSLTEQNPLLARAAVNRVWALLLGRGLVHPVDRMDARHPPSHPDLLDWLARDFEEHGFDLRRLMRGILLTETYRRESRWEAADPPPPAASFARAIERPLSAEQLVRSLLVATAAAPDDDGKFAGNSEAELLATFAAVFPDLFPEQSITTPAQGLFLSNSPVIDNLLQPAGTNTAALLLALETPAERIEAAHRRVLGRAPTESERQMFLAYLNRRTPTDGVAQMLWALVTSAEFLVNH